MSAPATPPAHVWSLPEKAIQFGSGRFVRAFVEDFIDEANRRNRFNGRIVIVQSTDGQRVRTLTDQDSLYTLCSRGLKGDEAVESFKVISSVSRALAASRSWNEIVECAANPKLILVTSNTTEVGIQLDPQDGPDLNPPRSFPGKLTAFLYHRYEGFDGAPDKGLVIVPCELIENNGDRLKEIVCSLAKRWELPSKFAAWVDSANRFCNSLVDRIVTGTPEPEEVERISERLGYEDRLLTVAELYSLWAIDGDDSVRSMLEFPEVNPTVIVTDDITAYRERKLRLLNGTHTISTPLSFLLGNNTILESMNHSFTSDFIERVVKTEIGPSLNIDSSTVPPYIEEVLQRFRNPYIKHRLLDITFQSALKLRLRIVPMIQSYYQKRREVPKLLAMGFAFFLLFMKGTEEKNQKVLGRRGDEPYLINDDRAAYFRSRWQRVSPERPEQLTAFVEEICRDTDLWGTNLAELAGFTATTSGFLASIPTGLPKAAAGKISVNDFLALTF